MEERLVVAIECALRELYKAGEMCYQDEELFNCVDEARFELDRALHEYNTFKERQ